MQTFAHLLFHTSPTELAVFVGEPLVLGGVALLACVLPALRAATLDPVKALRQD